MQVSQLMKKDFFHAGIQDRVDEILEQMISGRINSVPVLDDRRRLTGILVKADIYRFMTDPGHYGACPVEWVMTRDVVTASPDEDLKTVALKLLHNEVYSLPVIESGKVVGMISTDDLLRFFATMED